MFRNGPSAATLPPVAIGGVGGSGTRLVAELLRLRGVYTGDDLNLANDTLWFTLLFKRAEILDCGDAEFDQLTHALVSGLRGGAPLADPWVARIRGLAQDRPQHPASWLRQRADSLIRAASRSDCASRWGWKEPNTHLVIERLWQRLPDLRYVHVVRHGLDMAYSGNQNQLSLWGRHMLGQDGPITPTRALAYWCRVHERMRVVLEHNRHRMYWLDYDLLCREPQRVLADLASFLDLDRAANCAMPEIKPPPRKASLWSLDRFRPEDIAFVRSLGYEIC